MLLLASAYSSQALTIIIQGGSRNNTYAYVYASNTTIMCRNNGWNRCPALSAFYYGSIRLAHPGNEIMDFVFEQYDQGKTKGDAVLDGDLPISWWTDEEKTITIDIKSTDVKYTDDFHFSDEDEKK